MPIAYPWFGNPITFCLPFEEVCNKLITDSKVDAFLDRCDRNAKQACRYLMSSQASTTGSKLVVDMAKDAEYARKDDRNQRDDVLKCQEILDDAMSQLPGWWPKGLELSDLNRVNVLNTAMLTLRVTTREYAKSNRHTLRGDGGGNTDVDNVLMRAGEGGGAGEGVSSASSQEEELKLASAPGRYWSRTKNSIA
jgi:hypothetical protein